MMPTALKVQQPPYSYPHSRKCRALMHAYLSHVPLPGPLHEGVSDCQQSDCLHVCLNRSAKDTEHISNVATRVVVSVERVGYLCFDLSQERYVYPL